MGPKRLTRKMNRSNESVQVVVRCRPMSDVEIKHEHSCVVDIDASRGSIEITNPKQNTNEAKKLFTFDAVYDWTSTQEDIYQNVSPLVASVLSGFNGTIFAYGQTGTGKTHTMEGCLTDSNNKGIILRSFDQIFNHIGRSENQQFLVRTSYLEIYLEEIRDLLASEALEKCEIHEAADRGVYVKHLTSIVCKDAVALSNVVTEGNQCRTTGCTNMNDHSSRSHAILTVTIEMVDLELSDGDQKCVRMGRLNLVDLAGSERQGKSGAMGDRLKEASKINLSLSALGNVISALVDGRTTHVPYRDSKLTRLLQDSLGGNSKTIMVANIGPASYNYEESLTTLRYANRAKNIKNQPKVNEDPKDALLRQYREEIAILKTQLVEKQLRQTTQTRLVSGGRRPDNKVMEAMAQEKANEKSQEMAQLQAKELAAKMCEDKKLREELERKIENMESLVLRGGKNIIDHTNAQQRALELQTQQIAEKKRMEVLMRQQLERQEYAASEIQSSYSNLHQEVEVKTRKLKKVFNKFQCIKQDIHDITEEFNRDRRDVEMTQNELLKELKVKYMIIENFIPIEEKNKLVQRLVYNDELDDWLVKKSAGTEEAVVTKRPCANSERRPVSEYNLMAAAATRPPNNFRYKSENVLALSLYVPAKTTLTYQMPTVAPKIQAVLEKALMVEEDLHIDASKHAIKHGPSAKASNRGRRKSGNKQVKTTTVMGPPPIYPKTRGLVPKK